jgi:ESCRT-I complex subunit TSG101
VDADAAIVPADVLSRQALDGQAEDLALEDTLYSLDKALQAGSITPEVYIKQVGPSLLGPSVFVHLQWVWRCKCWFLPGCSKARAVF